jgi:hypothetical protein
VRSVHLKDKDETCGDVKELGNIERGPGNGHVAD